MERAVNKTQFLFWKQQTTRSPHHNPLRHLLYVCSDELLIIILIASFLISICRGKGHLVRLKDRSWRSIVLVTPRKYLSCSSRYSDVPSLTHILRCLYFPILNTSVSSIYNGGPWRSFNITYPDFSPLNVSSNLFPSVLIERAISEAHLDCSQNVSHRQYTLKL